MIKKRRILHNTEFSGFRNALKRKKIENEAGCEITFPVSPLPVFLPEELVSHLRTQLQKFFDVIKTTAFKEEGLKHVPEQYRVDDAVVEDFPAFSCYDFVFGKDSSGQPKPYLLECQGFPTMYGFIPWWGQVLAEDFNGELTPYIDFSSQEEYEEEIRKILSGTALVDISPKSQKLRIDFNILKKIADISVNDLTLDVIQGLKKEKIFNRLVPVEAEKAGRVDVIKEYMKHGQFVVHPYWFYILSKASIPALSKVSDVVPNALFVNRELPNIDLNKYVLKPVAEFSGDGVILDPKPEDISAALEADAEYIVQEKVELTPMITGPTRQEYNLEVRLVCIGERIAFSYCRLATSSMINIAFNGNNPFCGATCGLVEKK